MKRKSNKIKAEAGTNNHNGIVGVIGSIPFASTTLNIPISEEGIEIPPDWELIPGIRTIGRRKVAYQVLRKSPQKRFENDLNGKKRTTRSA
jgi:hypothetical protein